ncbi:hypothetical protein [Streptomyces sp. URMC 123]|uniref:hypothetical protein n=1 Tax=Streptomyces sp. URMC 123 TaxID=3423403 RepID=UPI003F1963A8
MSRSLPRFPSFGRSVRSARSPWSVRPKALSSVTALVLGLLMLTPPAVARVVAEPPPADQAAPQADPRPGMEAGTESPADSQAEGPGEGPLDTEADSAADTDPEPDPEADPIAGPPAGPEALPESGATEASPLAPVAPRISWTDARKRAHIWLTANKGKPVPYNQRKVWKDGYRQDCSGYVSMALRLPKPGPNTVAMANDRKLTKPITVKQLKSGDLLIDAIGNSRNRHVVIFEKWANAKKTAYWAFEHRAGHGTQHRVVSYGLAKGTQFKPYRPVNLAG